MPLEIGFSIEKVVIQPTSLCNLNCGYCYLPNRAQNNLMAIAVVEHIATGISQLGHPIQIVWHAGEPLSCRLGHFSSLIAPFEDLRKEQMVRHAIQTNATLINKEWCKFFDIHNFQVGVSFDGPPWANQRRVGWDGRPAFKEIMAGINHLKEAQIPFHVICVVSRANLGKAKELYFFFAELGCAAVGFNIEEQLGVYQIGFSAKEDDAVLGFWRTLFREWQQNPIIKVREFERVLPSLSMLSNSEPQAPSLYDAFPSIACNGDVVLLAPEFLNMKSMSYSNFIVGNVLNEDLPQIVARGVQSLYVVDFKKGVSQCKAECEYFVTCYGGQAGNKFFELDTLNGTETAFCRNSAKRVADAILCELISQKKGGITNYVA
jgi:uncharacterized protein